MFQDVSVNAIRHERNIIAHDSLINKFMSNQLLAATFISFYFKFEKFKVYRTLKVSCSSFFYYYHFILFFESLKYGVISVPYFPISGRNMEIYISTIFFLSE